MKGFSVNSHENKIKPPLPDTPGLHYFRYSQPWNFNPIIKNCWTWPTPKCTSENIKAAIFQNYRNFTWCGFGSKDFRRAN